MDKTRQGTTTKVALALIGIAMATGACAQDGDAQGDNETTEVASALGPNAPWVTWHQVTGILRRSGVEITDERLLVLRAAIFREHKGRPGERADKFSTSHATIPGP